MPHVSRKTKKNIAAFLAATVLAVVLSMAPGLFLINYRSTVLYSFLLILWCISVDQRIWDRRVRRLMLGAGLMLLILFILRFCRWGPFTWPLADRLLWDLLYIPFVSVPLLSLSAALCVGRTSREHPLRRIWGLWVLWALLCLGIATNELHGYLMRRPQGRPIRYGWLYWAVILWCLAISVFFLYVLIRRCRITGVRHLWYVPLAASLPGVGLIAAYYIAGGSPTLGGVKLYNLQEAYACLYILMWESCILMGLIPSNTDHPDMLRLSGLSAALVAPDGTVVYASTGDIRERGSTFDGQDRPSDRETPREGARGESSEGEAPVLVERRVAISGGEVRYTEDHTDIVRLNREMAEITELVEDENHLLEEENKIRTERARNEARDRLYDRVDRAIRPEVEALEQCLAKGDESADPESTLLNVMLHGVWIKRRANLLILGDDKETLSLWELYYAAREVCEYASLTGAALSAVKPEDQTMPEAPKDLVLAAFDLMDALVRDVCARQGAFQIRIGTDEGPLVRMAVDPEGVLPWESALRDRLRGTGAQLRSYEADETHYYDLIPARREEGGGV